MSVRIQVNGEPRTVEVTPDTPLLWVLRDHLQLTGTKYGCGVGQCGACTVHLDGAPVRSCSLPVGNLSDQAITTIEGLAGPHADALRAAWIALDVPQCGYCQSGQLMSAEALLRANPAPSDADIDEGMSDNLCRCATYVQIRRGIGRAATDLKERKR